jgi:hypothetical protein
MIVKPIIWRKVQGSFSSALRGRVGDPGTSPRLFMIEWSSTRRRDEDPWTLHSYLPGQERATYHATTEAAQAAAQTLLEEFVAGVAVAEG